MTFSVVSDLHAHAWSTFSGVNSDGVNTRLAYTLAELKRAAAVTKAQGGKLMVIAGDIFHTRGTIDPEVLNPVRDTFTDILQDLDVIAIPGNHDLKTRDTRRLSSAVENLAQINAPHRFMVYNEPTLAEVHGQWFAMVPWIEDPAVLYQTIEQLVTGQVAEDIVLVIHTGIDGVISGLSGGLAPNDLAQFGFSHVFSGHYHNHVDLGDEVYSVGALTHQTWGDVGTRAGFLMVDAGKVTFHDTEAPKFIDVTGLDEDEIELEAEGNYVRFRGPEMTQQEITDLRKQFLDWGALGVAIQAPRKVANQRSAAPAKGLTLEQSVEKFVTDASDIPASVDKDAVSKRALEVLNETRAVTEES